MKAELKEVYQCPNCNCIVEVIHPGKDVDCSTPKSDCCSKSKVEIKTEDKGNEKHVPIIQEIDNGVLVKVGSVEHPMEEKHFIQFIEIFTERMVMRYHLKSGEKPEAKFPVKKNDIVEVRELCNLHGLWKA